MSMDSSFVDQFIYAPYTLETNEHYLTTLGVKTCPEFFPAPTKWCSDPLWMDRPKMRDAFSERPPSERERAGAARGLPRPTSHQQTFPVGSENTVTGRRVSVHKRRNCMSTAVQIRPYCTDASWMGPGPPWRSPLLAAARRTFLATVYSDRSPRSVSGQPATNTDRSWTLV